MGWARPLRGDQEYPGHDLLELHPAGNLRVLQPARAGHSAYHSDRIRAPAASRCRMRPAWSRLKSGNVDRGMVQTWNVAFERQLPWERDRRHRVRRRQGRRRVRLGRTSTCRRPTAAAPTSRPYFATFGRQNADPVRGASACETAVQLAAGGVQPLVQPRVHVQGRVYAQQVDERVRRRRPHRAAPGSIRSSRAAIGRWPDSIARTTCSWASCIAAVAERRQRIRRCRARRSSATGR